MKTSKERIRTSPLHLRALTEEQLKSIHEASLEVLLHTGYHIPVAEVQDLLHDAGARVEGERVFIPSNLVDRALQSVQPVTIYDRAGEPALPLWDGKVIFGALADTFTVMDPWTQSMRPHKREDQRWFTRLLDALPNIDYVQVVGQSEDVPDEIKTQIAFSETVRSTTKPILVFPYDRKGLLDLLELANIIAYDEVSFRQKPFFMVSSVPAAPLYGTDYNLELLITAAELEVPLLYYSCPTIGGNSPCSLIGTLILGNADWLASLVIHQLKRPGAPFCTAGFTVQLMDMKTTLWSYCAPETQLAYAAVADLAHWYGFPAWGLEGISDIPQIDMQASLEMATNCTWAMLSNFEVVHNVGLMGAGKLLTAESAVLVDEIIAFARASAKLDHINTEAIRESIDLIKEVGPMGEYISHPHTFDHFREFWYPTLFHRPRFDPSEEMDIRNLDERIREQTKHLLESYTPESLSEDLLKEIDRLEASWYRRIKA
jgi:trimethylamine--corrinoid protein Co-methyltransferase